MPVKHGELGDAVLKQTDKLVSRGNPSSLEVLTVVSSQAGRVGKGLLLKVTISPVGWSSWVGT